MTVVSICLVLDEALGEVENRDCLLAKRLEQRGELRYLVLGRSGNERSQPRKGGIELRVQGNEASTIFFLPVEFCLGRRATDESALPLEQQGKVGGLFDAERTPIMEKPTRLHHAIGAYDGGANHEKERKGGESQ